MYKKIITTILSIVLCLSLFTGCTLFTYDYERDYKQVIATIDSTTITDGSASYTTKKKDIYKYELINSVNAYAPTYVQYYGMSVEEAVDYLAEQLVVTELVLNEADAQLHFGNIEWTNYETNQVRQSVYNSIDAQLADLRNDVLTEHGEPITSDSTTTNNSSETQTTYPTETVEEEGAYDHYSREDLIEEVVLKELANEEKAEGYSDYKLRLMLEKYDLSQEELWMPGESRYPGRYGSDEVKSLEIEAMRRFLNLLAENVENDYRLTEEQKVKFGKEVNDLKRTGNDNGLSYVYPALIDTEVIEFFIGSGYRKNVKLSLLQEYITSSVDVTDEEIRTSYQNLLTSQMDSYATQSNFDSAVTGGSTTILYYPNDSYYFVKHILVPFSDEQTAELKAYVEKYEGIKPQAELDQKKVNLANEIKGFEHRAGENYGKPLTIAQIYEDIESVMASAVTLKDKDRAFDSLIYKYNTDPGIFGKELGYQVKKTTGDAYDETYMKEFSLAAKALYEAGVEGAISPVAVTDYGVHILYLSKIIPSSGLTLGMNDYISYGERTTVFEKLREEKLTSKTNAIFSEWQNNRIGYYFNLKKIVTINESTFDDLKGND